MKRIGNYNNTTWVVLVICIAILGLTQCISNSKPAKKIKRPPIPFSEFAGSASCASCHKDIYQQHLKTAHFQTSSVASDSTIMGSLKSGENFFAYSDESKVFIEKKHDSFFQAEYDLNKLTQIRPMDIVVGSGTKGQTFLFWEDEHLYQLPITYFSATHQWCNSPGFPRKSIFNRPITSRCLECHSTYFSMNPGPKTEPENFNKQQIIYGVTCEKCHGPAAKHVQYHTQNQADSAPKYIVNPARFTRQQSLDLCALCHGGRLKKTQQSFTFTAGNYLADFFRWDSTNIQVNEIDVHGNQYGLLKASKCFLQSEQMTCNTCHNPHQSEKGNLKKYSTTCMSCHQAGNSKTCSLHNNQAKTLENNCIDCHMPKQESKAIMVMLPGGSSPTPARLRTHYISVYKDQVENFIKNNNIKH
jgi:predicted CXXCH cytochrome family protein